MKALLAVLAVMLCVVARADVAEVKRVMDEPVVISYIGRRQGGYSTSSEDYSDMATFSKKSVQELQQKRGINISLREYFTLIGGTQGTTAHGLSLMRHMTATNASMIREKLLPALKAANLSSAASDLEEALKSTETSKTLERTAQDRFARLAKVAP